MKKSQVKMVLCGVLAILCCWVPISSAQVTSNVYTRVLYIQAGERVGTAFTMDVDGRQYLITAKHLTIGLKEQDLVNVYSSNKWSPTPVKVLRCKDPVDIAVLVPSRILTPSYLLEPISGNRQITIGQDVYFVGFPLGLSMEDKGLNRDYPLGIVKKGVLSASFNEEGVVIYLLDAFNNPGFSGAPVVYRETPHADAYVLGVVSGFPRELSPVMTPRELRSGEDTSKIEPWRIIERTKGHKEVLVDTGQLVNLNPGIVICYGIKHAIELIQQNPLGPKIAQ